MRNLAATKVKSNAKYTCQECGATELIQAHHEIPGDDASLIVLCAECHSVRHPSVPKALFLSPKNQPYWGNKSAASLSRELGVHPRTIIRTARKLGIHPGILIPVDEELIKNRLHKLGRKQVDGTLLTVDQAAIELRRRLGVSSRLSLGLSYESFVDSIKTGRFPIPTYMNTTVKRGGSILTHRYFNEEWIRNVETMLNQSMRVKLYREQGLKRVV